MEVIKEPEPAEKITRVPGINATQLLPEKLSKTTTENLQLLVQMNDEQIAISTFESTQGSHDGDDKNEGSQQELPVLWIPNNTATFLFEIGR